MFKKSNGLKIFRPLENKLIIMKKIYLSLILVAGILSSLVSCSDDLLDPVAAKGDNIVLSAPTGGTYALTASTASATAFTAKWTSSTFGYSAAARYTLQVIKSTGNFSAPGTFPLGDYGVETSINLEKAITNRQLNAALLGAGGAIGTSQTYKIRVVGSPVNQSSSTVDAYTVVSNEVTITATAFDTYDEFARIYVPGNYQGASGYGNSWSPDSPSVAKLFSAGNNGIYEGFVWMNDAAPEFKFTPVPAWSGDKGESNGSGAFSGLLGTSSNIKPSTGAGAYFFTVNWNTGAYTMDKRQVSIIGAATPNGWGTGTPLTFDTNPSSPYYQMYTINLTLAADEFLIRLKDDWSVKMGTLSGSSTAENVTTGGQYKIKLGGGNMKVPTAGNYKVVLDIRNSANYNIRLMPQ
jgi:hypothetical protein